MAHALPNGRWLGTTAAAPKAPAMLPLGQARVVPRRSHLICDRVMQHQGDGALADCSIAIRPPRNSGPVPGRLANRI